VLLCPIDISARQSVLGTEIGVPGQGQRPRTRGQILQVHSGHCSTIRRWPAKGHQGAKWVVGLWDRIGQDRRAMELLQYWI